MYTRSVSSEMDVRVLLIFLAVTYVDVSARIMCNFHPQSWIHAMAQCLQQRGTLVGNSTEFSLTGLHVNGSFWTADYASLTETASSPIECEYRTKGTDIQFSQIKTGNCDEMKHYICRDHNMTQPSVKTGTWKEASKCNETYSAAAVELTVGDYWLRTAYQNYVLTGNSERTIDRCGMLYVNGTFQFISSCDTLQYSFCEVESYSGAYLSECGSTIITKQPSSNNPQTCVSHKTETLTTSTMSINGDTSTESIYRNESSSSLGSSLSIGLGASISIVVIVLISTVGLCIYKRRYRRKSDNSQVSVHMNALNDVSCQNETPRKTEHTNESYEYAVPSLLRTNDVKWRGVKGIETEFADLNAYSKVIPSRQRNANKVDLQSRKANNTGFAGDSTIIKAENAVVMSDEYDDVNSNDAPDPINMNVYSHLGSHDHDDEYDIASCTQKQQTQEEINDYDRLDKRCLQLK